MEFELDDNDPDLLEAKEALADAELAGPPIVTTFTSARNNAELIAMAAQLGYLQRDWDILDPTYGQGRFWKEWRPESLIGTDIDPKLSLMRRSIDFTDMPFRDECFDAVVFDPPYKLNGTPGQGGPADSDDGYGVGKKGTTEERMALIYDGLDECARVLKLKGYLLVKIQDQVVSGHKVFQTFLIADYVGRSPDWGESAYLTLVDQLHLPGMRAQPPGTRQVHSRQNYSTLLIFQKKT